MTATVDSPRIPFPTDGPLAEQRLLRRFRSGDDSAFGELYETLRPAAQRYARRLVGASDAEDVVADAFTKVFRAIRNGHGPVDQPAPYLMYAIRTTAWHHRRQHNQELDKSMRLEPALRVAAPAHAPLDDDLVAAMGTLCCRYQQVIWWFEVEGRSAAEVGAELGMSPNAASALAYRARRALRRAYSAASLAAGTA